MRRENDKTLAIISDFAYPLLVFFTIFASFAKHHDLDISRPEIPLLATCLAAAAAVCGGLMLFGGRLLRALMMASLLVLFIDVQFDMRTRYLLAVLLGVAILVYFLRRGAGPALTAAFAAMFVAVVALPGGQSPTGPLQAAQLARRPEPAADLPILVHLILDEHIGIGGIPREIAGAAALRSRITEFYVSQGFRLYGKAYSRYVETANAIPNALNFTAAGKHLAHVTRTKPKILKSNRYFDALRGKGYAIHVSQFDHLDYCTGARSSVHTCRNLGWDRYRAFQRSDFSAREKAWVIWSAILSNSRFHVLVQHYERHIRAPLARAGIGLPPFPLGHPWGRGGNILPIAHLEAFGDLADEIAGSTRGHAHFAHFSLPHQPYILDGECRSKPVGDWGLPLPKAPSDSSEAAAAWEANYLAYLDQVRCVQRKLREFFDKLEASGVWEDAVIIIHGDHGSRIWRAPLTAPLGEVMAQRVHQDGFSTLFAVKAPGYAPGYDTTAIPLEVLLSGIVSAGPRRQAGDHDPYVFVKHDRSGELRREPFRGFEGRKGWVSSPRSERERVTPVDAFTVRAFDPPLRDNRDVGEYPFLSLQRSWDGEAGWGDGRFDTRNTQGSRIRSLR